MLEFIWGRKYSLSVSVNIALDRGPLQFSPKKQHLVSVQAGEDDLKPSIQAEPAGLFRKGISEWHIYK